MFSWFVNWLVILSWTSISVARIRSHLLPVPPLPCRYQTRSMNKDYTNLLEVNHAKARQRILILEARCAMLSNRERNVPPPTSSASLAPVSQHHDTHRHGSTLICRSQTSQQSKMWLHGRTSRRAISSPRIATSRYFPAFLLSLRGRSVSFADKTNAVSSQESRTRLNSTPSASCH